MIAAILRAQLLGMRPGLGRGAALVNGAACRSLAELRSGGIAGAGHPMERLDWL
jgi:hypothetical protein